jgi:polyisoprenoid-binding protein YceI
MYWKIDPAHSEINFSVRHMMISNVRGRFETFSGEVNFDEAQPNQSTVDVLVEMASINTRDSKRDAHLRSPDFFDAEKYPLLKFRSKHIEIVTEDQAKVVGDLTIRDQTREVTLDATYAGSSKSPWGSTSAGFSASTRINRKDWGLGWNVALETGGWLVGDEIKIDLELEIVKQEEMVTA